MPDSGPPDDPELLLENVANLDTARMTLRWALERIRGLERSGTEVQELLQRSYAGRQKAEGELDEFKRSVEDRLRKLAEKERFVSDMQRILNDLFKGDVDVAEFVKRRQALDEERAHLESQVRRRLEEAEAGQKREIAENSRRLTEMEGVYSASLAEAQRGFHAELERIESEHAASLRTERERYDQFRSETQRESVRMAEEYQRRLLILEHEYAAKRTELTGDLDRLKARLVDEAKAADAARAAEAAREAERWLADRAALEARLAEREKILAALETAMKGAEAAYFSRDEARRAEHAGELQALGERHAAEGAGFRRALEAARVETARREESFQAERMAWVGERNALRAKIASEYEGLLETLRAHGEASLAEAAKQAQALRDGAAAMAREFEAERAKLLDEQTSLRRLDAEKFSEALRQLEHRFHERELEARKENEGDIEALRRHFEDALQRQRGESRKEIEAHAQEVQTLRARLREQQEDLSRALEAAEKRRIEELRASEALLAERHTEDLERLRRDRDEALAGLSRAHAQALEEAGARLAAAQARAAAEREELVARQEALRVSERSGFQDALRAQAEEAAARELQHARRTEALAEEARALREAFAQERLDLMAKFDAALERRQKAHEEELAAVRLSRHDSFEKDSGERAALLRAHELTLNELQKSHARELLERTSALRDAVEEQARARRKALDEAAAAHEQSLREQARTLQAALAEQSGLRAEAERNAEAALSELTRAHAEERARLRSEHEAALERAVQERQAERTAEQRRREERLAELEGFYAQSRTSGAKDAADQLEQLRRHYRRALDAMRRELDPNAPEAAAESRPVVHRVPRRWPWAAAVAAAVTLALFMAVNLRNPAAPPSAPALGYEVPFKNTTALAWKGESLWAADWKESAVFRLTLQEGRLTVSEKFPLPESHITGMAVLDDTVYISDSWSRQIQRWKKEGDLLLQTGSWASPGSQPSALFFDGTNLWSADVSERKIYRHAMDDRLTVLATYPVDLPVIGLWADAERFWTADSANRLIHRHRWDDTLSLVASYALKELDDGKAPVSAFAMKEGGPVVWLARDGQGTILERPLSAFEPRPALPQP
ncbi:MAG: hypothetical protein HY928_15185 [Elusimicrobia bacterium]|nr:hypothetical protein [Elusimicrobiota bacterium]